MNSGSTTSLETGPDTDHTIGSSNGLNASCLYMSTHYKLVFMCRVMGLVCLDDVSAGGTYDFPRTLVAKEYISIYFG